MQYFHPAKHIPNKQIYYRSYTRAYKPPKRCHRLR